MPKNNSQRDRKRVLWDAIARSGRHPVCHWCKKELTYDAATVEHLIARSKGGSKKRSNLRLACAPCNRNRNDGGRIDVFAPAEQWPQEEK